jgi:hypothetical protein
VTAVTDALEFQKEMEETRGQWEIRAKSILKKWLEENPGRFIFVRNYIPSFNDGDACTLTWATCIVSPGYDDNMVVASQFLQLSVYADDAEEVERQKAEIDASFPKDGTESTIETLVIDTWEFLNGMANCEGVIKLQDGELLFDLQYYYCD